MTDSPEKRTSYALLTLPGILIYGLVILFPIVTSVGLSFTEWGGFGMPQFRGFKNYLEIFSHDVFWKGFKNNIWIVLVSVFGQIPVGFVLAYILHRRHIKGVDFFKSMIFLPISISAIVVAILWKKIFATDGLITGMIRMISGDSSYVNRIFEHPNLAITPILFVIFWMYTGVYMIMFYANLQKVSQSTIEAAIIDGASEGRILMKIIFPSMLGILFTAIIFAISGSFKSFDLIYAMTGGNPAHFTEVIAIYMYNKTFIDFDYGYGSAISTIIVGLSLFFISIVRIIFRQLEKEYGL